MRTAFDSVFVGLSSMVQPLTDQELELKGYACSEGEFREEHMESEGNPESGFEESIKTLQDMVSKQK